MKNYKNIDSYISDFPEDVQEILEKVRAVIHSVVPEATEKISYGIPTFYLDGNLVHFAGYKGHIGFYPGAGPIETFASKLKKYHTSKGTVQFPLDEPIPYKLIEEITKFCVKRNKEKSKNKK